MNNIIFNTELIKGAKGDTGDTGLSYEVPTGAVIAYDGQGVPEGYIETTEPSPPTEGVDANKVSYEIGINSLPKLKNGRFFSGFYTMNGHQIRPMDENGWLDVDWSKSFEMGIAFKLTAQVSRQSLWGEGYYHTYRKTPRIYYSRSDSNKLWLCISTDGSTLAINALLDYSIVADTWYFVKLSFDDTTNTVVCTITNDFANYTELYNGTLANAPYYNGASLCVGGDGQDPLNSSDDSVIDLYNTYVKDDTDEIVWGAYKGSFS